MGSQHSTICRGTRKLLPKCRLKNKVSKFDEKSANEDNYYINHDHKKKFSESLSSSVIYKAKDSRHLSQQSKPLFIANLLSGSEGQKYIDEIKNLKDLEQEKIYTGDQTNKAPPSIRKTVKRSTSESQDKNV